MPRSKDVTCHSRTAGRKCPCGFLNWFRSLFDSPKSHRPLMPMHRRIALESLEERSLLSSVPTATLSLPATSMIGETFEFRASFDNTSPSDTGYGPFVDVVFPKTGTDGKIAPPDDGIEFVSANYMGSPLVTTVLTFDLAGEAVHPYAVDTSGAPVIIHGTPGDQLVVFQLPFGSFTPEQPAADISITARTSNLAVMDAPLDITATGGFQFGNTPLPDPATDPSIFGPTDTHANSPVLMTLTKTCTAPESETATGENYPRHYRLSVDIADGQTLTNFNLADLLANNLAFLTVNSMTAGGVVTAIPSIGVAANPPDNDLAVQFASVTGGTGSEDVFVDFSFFVPELDANGNHVLDPNSGGAVTSENNASASGYWTPLDPRDPPQTVTIDLAGPEHVLTDRSIAIQKSVALVTDVGTPGYTPGDTVEYTLSFQISDYFAFTDLVVDDLLSDGQRFDNTFTPTLNVTENRASTGNLPFTLSNYSVIKLVPPSPLAGSTLVHFNISNQLNVSGGLIDGLLVGGLVPDGGTLNDGATTGTVKFRTVIQDRFDYDYPSGNPQVTENDTLSDFSPLQGNIVDNATVLDPVPIIVGSQTDASTAGFTIVHGSTSKQLYAVNGTIGAPAVITPGDVVTYRLSRSLSLGDFENFRLIDYVPRPIYDVDDPQQTGAVAWTWTQDMVGTTPISGQFMIGPSDTLFSSGYNIASMVVSADTTSGNNILTFNLGNYDYVPNNDLYLDLLFSITVSDEPFADGLLLTNQLQTVMQNTREVPTVQTGIQQVQLTEPVLTITKGIVSTDSPGHFSGPVGPSAVTFNLPGSAIPWTGTINSSRIASQPIDANLSGIDAGDTATFAITLENIGTSANGAFDVRFNDTLPAGYVIPTAGLNLQVRDGTGVPLAYTDLGGGIFGAGIELVDGSSTGSLAGYAPNSGKNIGVITFDLTLASTVVPSEVLANTAVLFNYAGVEGGPDHTLTDLEDNAQVTVKDVEVTKTILSTNQAFTIDPKVAIGELVQYDVNILVPEGTLNLVNLVDTLDSGLAFVSFDSIVASPALSTSMGTFANVLAAATVTDVGSGDINMGRRVSMDFGTVVNTDTSNIDNETITIVYTVAVLNSTNNDAGNQRNNSAVFSHDTTAASQSAPNVQIAEPLLNIAKTVSPTTGDAGDTMRYTLVLSHDPASTTDAFDINLTDTLPAGTTFVPGSLHNSSGIAPDSLIEVGGLITATWSTLAKGSASTITFDVVLGQDVNPSALIDNASNITWTSLPGDVIISQSPYNPIATERTGNPSNPGGAANDYRDSGNAQIQVFSPSMSKVISSTSRTDTHADRYNPTIEDLAIGEEVTFLVTVTLPESTTQAIIVDTLPTFGGILQLDYVSSQVLWVGSNITGSLLTPGDPGVFDGNDNITFDFGTVTDVYNNVSGPGDQLRVEIVARVADIAANTNGVVLTNEAEFQYTGGSITASRQTEVVEPKLQVTKTVTPTGGDAGDIFTYLVSVQHTAESNLNAYDVVIADLLTDPMLNLMVGSVTTNRGTIITGNTPGDTTIQVDISELPLGTVANITYQVQLGVGTAPGETVTNTAVADWDNTPGSGGRPGADSSSAQIITAVPVYDKTIIGTSLPSTGSAQHDPTITDLAIGEEVTYKLLISMPEGTSSSLVINDLLPISMSPAYDYLSLINATVSRIGANVTTQFLTVGSSGTPGNRNGNATFDDAVFNFGQVINTPDGQADQNDEIEMQITARVVDVPPNVDGTQLVNLMRTVLNGGAPIDTTRTVELVEPVLQIAKAASVESADAGDVITYTLTVSHQNASTSDAYNVVIADLLADPSLQLVAGSVVNSTGTVVTGNSVGDTTIRVNISQLPLGAQATISYQVRVSSTAMPGSTHSNTATLNWNSYTGAGGREGNSTASDTISLYSSSIAGSVYVDANNNGFRDPGERGIAGVTVTLTGTNNLGGSVNIPTTSDASGNYSFTALRPGTYTLTESQPGSYLDGKDAAGTQGGNVDDLNDIIANIALPTGQSTSAIDYLFGELEPSVLNGYVYWDSNNDGIFSGTDLPIRNTAVTLAGIDDRGTTISPVTVLSNNAGLYSFPNIRPGSYNITETQPAGYLDGIDSLGTLGGFVGQDMFMTIPVASGQVGTSYNFGELLPSSLSGYVYDDLNNNGQREPGEPGIGNVTITLTGIDDRGSVTEVITTDANGLYLFDNLRAGTYAITETPPAAFLDGIDTIGTPGGDTGVDQFTNIVLEQDVVGVNNNFGELEPASISGSVYVDENDNGRRDPGEPGIKDVAVTLTGMDDRGDPVITVLTTDLNGDYAFVWLRPSNTAGYTVTETQPAGYLEGTNRVGTLGGALGNNAISDIVVYPGNVGTLYQFAELIPASLSGSVYVDANNNGVRDYGEVGIPNVPVTVTGVDDHGNAVHTTLNTDANGNYSFNNLRPCTVAGYTLIEDIQPVGYLDGKDRVGSLGGVLGNDMISAIPVVSGDAGVNYWFGELLPARISGIVWYDYNANGRVDPTEPRLGNVLLTLTGTDDLGQHITRTTYSNSNGDYAFEGLRPGTYAVYETQPPQYLDGREAIGVLGGKNPMANLLSEITLQSGDDGFSYNFGEGPFFSEPISKRWFLSSFGSIR